MPAIVILGVEVAEALANTAAVLSILNSMQGLQGTDTTTIDGIRLKTDLMYSILTDPLIGNSALLDKINTLSATIAIDVTAILAGIAAAQQAANPVILPTIPPAGYGGVSGTDVGSLVWGYAGTTFLTTAGDYLRQIREGNWFDKNFGGQHFAGCPYFNMINATVLSESGLEFPIYPLPNPATILITDTLDTWLTAQMTGFTPFTGTSFGGATQWTNNTDGGQWITILDTEHFTRIKELFYPPAAPMTLPLWPGLANVTLGASVALASVLTLTAPMDGAIVVITSVPSKQGQFVLGDLVSYRNVGGIAFVDDNGDAEYPQTLGFQSAVYCPKAMAHASGLVLRASPGVIGTVTPWTIT